MLKTTIPVDPHFFLKLWKKMAPAPGGKRTFSWLMGRALHYSGSIGARVEELSPGYCKLTMQETQSVRNHLHSVHAMALANLGELSTGLAVTSQLPPNFRAILVAFKIRYKKKARGLLTVEGKCAAFEKQDKHEVIIVAPIKNTANEEVAEVEATWLVGPNPPPR